uniref:Uncharacterized protein n=1 Tax=Siphoviridae sp. ctGJ32 TaxID=2825409 RepID=A0A8S5TV46_9CAUD|nr:MAG TPA: hypothetical protein [Siphoviridae sp. ctGJ32]DAS58728.1 MAG TPA: hypothetical protein [Caudoviricetes sp.]
MVAAAAYQKELFERWPFLCYNMIIHHRQRATRLSHSSFLYFKKGANKGQ